jgi:hypothetical protein
MDNLKEFRIVVTVKSDLVIDIKGKEPCDVLAVSGSVIRTLRNMNLEPKAQVMP